MKQMFHVGQAEFQASLEGRLDPRRARELGLPTGGARCPVCGMLCWDVARAQSCCRPGNREREHLGAPGWAVAEVVDAAALVRAADVVVAREGLVHRARLAPYPKFWRLVERGQLVWLRWETWSQLLMVFDGRVPGCQEIEGA